MNVGGWLIFCATMGACAGLLPAGAAAAAEDAPAEFVSPDGAKPARRVGGAAVRCSADPNLYVSVLAPAETVGLTTAEQPTLYWYASKATPDPVEIAITDLKDKSKTVLELTLPGVKKPGLQKLDLAAHKARLAPGGQYEWVIEVVTSQDAASRNASAVARVARVGPAAGPAATPPAGAGKADVAAFFAKRGVWFDYMAALLDALHAAPGDKALLARLGGSLKKEKLIWKEDGNIDELVAAGPEKKS